jgi:hypothetical protein
MASNERIGGILGTPREYLSVFGDFGQLTFSHVKRDVLQSRILTVFGEEDA